MKQNSQDRKVYLKLSFFYFSFFSLLGAFAPFISLYLSELKFSLFEIGLLSSILLITKVFAPNLWSWLGDHYGHRLQLIRLGAFCSLVFFSGLLFSHSFWVIAVCIAGFSFFWNAILPQYEVITLYNLGDEKHRYSIVRVWGSIGFVLSVYLLGLVFEWVSILWLPFFLFGLLLLILISSLSPLRDKQSVDSESMEGLTSLIIRPSVIAFILINLLLQVGHGPYYTFFSIYLESLNYSKSAIGAMWALGVVAEVVLFFMMRPLLMKYSLRLLSVFALAVTALRWFITAFYADVVWVLFIAQIGHAASFGVMHIVAIHFVNQSFKGRHEGQGQALYSSLSFGLGGALGAYLSGVYAEIIGIDQLFISAGCLTLVALVICLKFFHEAGPRPLKYR